jgi:hypothetical protein
MNNRNAGRYLGEETPAEMEEELYRQAVWKEVLGVDLPARRDETTAPPVDTDALCRLVRGELMEEHTYKLACLCLYFRSWADALLRTKIEQELLRRGNNAN